MSQPVVCIADSVEVPLYVRSLRAFRRWAFSPGFPQTGRIDYVGGRIELDMSPEGAFTHGSPKVELIRVLGNYLNQQDVGLLFSDRMRVTSLEADLSAEPDVVFVSYSALQEGRAAFEEPTKRAPREFLELRGAPDLVVEILSPGSIRKDTRDLPPRYFMAGVREFWLVDALRTPFRFQVFGRGSTRFMARRRDQFGFQPSAVLGVKVLMEQRTTARGFPGYRLALR